MQSAEMPTLAKRYDLQDRTHLFGDNVRTLLRAIPKTMANTEDARQLLRSSGSVGANYIEANEGLGKKDFLVKIRTARKEAKESIHWLKFLYLQENATLEEERKRLVQEARELVLILSAIIRNTMLKNLT